MNEGDRAEERSNGQARGLALYTPFKEDPNNAK